MVDNIQIQFMVEKSIGKGEDSAPILFSTESSAITGVFDGMGGSGASICMSDFGEGHTKAYVASRIIRDAIYNYLNDQSGIDTDIIKNVCLDRLALEKEKYPSAKSTLRSKLVRDYPTTLALASAKDDSDEIVIDSYWAGDSRNYLWMKDGFFQISKDDLIDNNDPLENLSNDSALSNCVCADQDFLINHLCLRIPKQPFILLSATDGCFGYFHTPMHFENLLASSLFASQSLDEWEKFLIERIQEVTGDDFSLSLVAIGFKDFNSLKEMLGMPTNEYVVSIIQQQEKISEIKERLIESEMDLKTIIRNCWNEYQSRYSQYISIPLEANRAITESELGEVGENSELVNDSDDSKLIDEKEGFLKKLGKTITGKK